MSVFFCNFAAELLILILKNRIAIILLCCLCCLNANAYTRLNPEFQHFILIDGALGYSSLYNHTDSMPSGNGVSPYLGVGYRLVYNKFLFATGLEAHYLYNAYSTSGAKRSINMLDTEGDPFRLHVDATDGNDWVHAVNLNIPVLLGMEYRRFYFLAGPKLSLNVWNQMQTQAIAVTTATYEQYIGTFENMPNHMLDTYPVESKNLSADWDLDIITHLEVGMRLGDVSFETGADVPKPKQRFYIALYADYGLLNLNGAEAKYSRLDYEQVAGQPLRIFLTPALMSKEYSGVRVNQWSVGVKATVLLELPKQRDCVMCEEVIDVFF